MFKRIKNLLDISRYTVEELKTPLKDKKDVAVEIGYVSNGKGLKEIKRPVLDPVPTSSSARIIELKSSSPFDEFTYDPTQQSSDDTTIRN